MKNLLNDLRYAARLLKKSPAFTIVAVLTLALGIGANTAIFSVVNAVLLNPLPFSEPDRLLALWEEASSIGFPQNNAAVANYLDWQNRNTTFEDIAAYSYGEYNLTGAGEPIKLQAAQATANFFPVLRVKPLHGRIFTPEEDQADGDRVVLLSYGIWQSAFGGETSVVGRTITLSGEKYTVIGIMPRGFAFPNPEVDLWMPERFNAEQRQSRGSHSLNVIGRLKPVVSMEQARADIAAITAQLQQEYPETNKQVGSLVISLRDEYIGGSRSAYLSLLVGVAILLLITCANVASLLLVRASGRQREIAVRAALGAGRLQLFRQMLVESLLLSTAGGLCGILAGWWAFDFVSILVPARMSGWVHLSLDWRVMLFCVLLSVLSGLVFGLVPLLTATRFDLARVLQQGGGRSGVDSGSRTRNVLVVGEVALSVVLLIGAGLLIRSFDKLRSVDLGFRTDDVLTVNTDLPGSKYESYAPRMNFYNTVLERVRAMPGVRAAGYITAAPLQWKGGTNSFTIEGRPPLPVGHYNDANSRIATAGYFEAMGIPLERGRLFNDNDGRDTPPVVVINEAMAKQFWPDENPLGKRFRFNDGDPWFTIIGVVGSTRQMGVDLNARAEFYRANQQIGDFMWNRQHVGREDGGRSPATRGWRAPDRSIHRSGSAGRIRADHGRDRRSRDPTAPRTSDSARSFRVARGGSGVTRDLRSPFLRRVAAHARDRVAHGLGSAEKSGPGPRHGQGLAPVVGGAGRRSRRRVGREPPDGFAAV